MKFWQYDASKYSGRLEARLRKYSGGQILLITREGEELRGPFTTYTENGTDIRFHLIWLARKRIITPTTTFSKGEWKWEVTHPVVRQVACHLHLQMTDGSESEDAEEPKKEVTPPEADNVQQINVKRFYQDKPMWGKNPKCLFFTTNLGEKGTLFQPHDPRNLRLETKDGESFVIDPTHPQSKTPK